MPARKTPPKMFETRSHAWQEVGLLRQISPRVVKRARLEALVLVPLFVGVVVLYDNRVSLFGTHRSAAATGENVRSEHGARTRRSAIATVTRADDPRLGDRPRRRAAASARRCSAAWTRRPRERSAS